MGYRVHPTPPPPKPRRSTSAINTLSEHYITNGSRKQFAFPCFYQEVVKPRHAHLHDRHWHDHVGWPSPNHPDHICQIGAPQPYDLEWAERHHLAPFEFLIDPHNLIPIHLTEEGYDSFAVSWRESEEHMPVMTASIDQEDDWVVRADVQVDLPEAIEEPKTFHFAITAQAPGQTSTKTSLPLRPGEQAKTVTKTIPPRKDQVIVGKLVVLPASYTV